MLSSQFIELLNQYKKYNVKISHNEIAILCLMNKEYLEDLMKTFYECYEYNKSAFLEIMKNEEFFVYHKYLGVLDIISDINSTYTEELMSILNKPGITRLPKFYDYINAYHCITTNPKYILTNSFKDDIEYCIPDSLEVYQKYSNPEIIRLELKGMLLDTIEEAYEYFVTNKDVIYFEDDESEGVIEDLEWFFDMRNKDKQYDANKLVRAIKPKNMPKKNNVIQLDFKRKD